MNFSISSHNQSAATRIRHYFFKGDPARYEGVARINIYLLRALYGLMAAFVGKDAWITC